MKSTIYLILFQIFLFFTSTTFAQEITPPLFGQDIVIQDQPGYNQRSVSVCSAFNGWLYSAYIMDSLNVSNFKVFRSQDHGVTWEPFYTPQWWIWDPSKTLNRVDLATCGSNLNDLKLLVGFSYDIFGTSYMGGLMRLNGVTAEMENDCLIYDDQEDIKDIDLCSDGNYTASGSIPGAVAFLYSQGNEVRIRISRDGGLTFNELHTIATCTYPGKPDKVSLAYGYSPLWDSGKFYAVWEAKNYLLFPNGHIYYSRSEGDLTTGFIPPVCLDSLNAYSSYQGSNPVICCQYGFLDNDNQNLTTIVLFEVPNFLNGGKDIMAFYNKEATTSTEFIPFSFTNPEHINQMPATAFNPYDSTFILTWYDKTLGTLPYITKEMNMSNPNSWNFVSDGYNDTQDLNEPHPQLCINPIQQSGACVWIRESNNEIGQAMYDFLYGINTNIYDKYTDSIASTSIAAPNPCNASTIIIFNMSDRGKAEIAIYSLQGKLISNNPEIEYHNGDNRITIQTLNFQAGTYIYTINTGTEIIRGKLCVYHN
jgi:hypothetical protein